MGHHFLFFGTAMPFGPLIGRGKLLLLRCEVGSLQLGETEQLLPDHTALKEQAESSSKALGVGFALRQNSQV